MSKNITLSTVYKFINNFKLFNRRYQDKDRVSPKQSTTTTTERKESPINVNVNVKTANKVGAVKPTTKKINMGAATNFGKNELGINSPTHTEQSFSANNNVTNSNNDLLDDLFNSSPNKKSNVDDFNPRAEETQEFGDFTSAFGGPSSTQKPTNEFADFGTAFVSSTNINNTTSLEDTLFDIPTAAVNSQYENISNVDLFGNNAISQSMSSSNNSDLLSDFGSLNINTPINSGKFTFYYFHITFSL